MFSHLRHRVGSRQVILNIVILLTVIGGTGPSGQSNLPGNVVEIVAGDYFLQGPDTIVAGLTTFQLRLHSGGHALEVVKLDDGKTVADYVESWKLRTPRPWAHSFGGPAYPSEARPANATLTLEAGNYVLADILNEGKYDGTGHLSKGMYRVLTVLPSSQPRRRLSGRYGRSVRAAMPTTNSVVASSVRPCGCGRAHR